MSLANDFAAIFAEDALPRTASDANAVAPIDRIASGFSDFVGELGGASFRSGLYRVHSPSEMHKWTRIVEGVFPAYRGKVICFAYDWLGRQFALHYDRLIKGQAQTLLFDPGFHEALEIPCTFETLHRTELPEYSDEALAARFHAQWLLSGGEVPGPSQCVGYRVPPKLGGKDAVENLEIIDMEVYWELS